MTSLTIKNIPDNLYKKIKQQAKKNRRSINNEVIYMIERSIDQPPVDKAEFLADVRALRKQLNVYLTDETVDRAINEGRP